MTHFCCKYEQTCVCQNVFVGVFVATSLNDNKDFFCKSDKHSNTPAVLFGDPNITCVFVSVFVGVFEHALGGTPQPDPVLIVGLPNIMAACS